MRTKLQILVASVQERRPVHNDTERLSRQSYRNSNEEAFTVGGDRIIGIDRGQAWQSEQFMRCR